MSFKEPDKVEIITTSDGSNSLYLPSLDETYHSIHGAFKESQYVFVEQGLAHFSRQLPKVPVRILEVGLGTGLNLLLSAAWVRSAGFPVSYTALEPYPLPLDVLAKLNYPNLLGESNFQQAFKVIHDSLWLEQVSMWPGFSFIKIPVRLEDFLSNDIFEIVYFDAFAPSKQPEIWSKANLTKLHKLMSSDGILVTYCAQGQFKRDLQSIGFEVETLPGPPGKFEMVRAIKSK